MKTAVVRSFELVVSVYTVHIRIGYILLFIYGHGLITAAKLM